jgi:hypothetical protein
MEAFAFFQAHKQVLLTGAQAGLLNMITTDEFFVRE